MQVLLAAALGASSNDPVVLAWHGGFPRFHESTNENIFAFSEVLAASIHLISIIVQFTILYYCNSQLEGNDEDAELARRLNPLYKWEALLHAPGMLLWVLSGHQLGVWVLAPAAATRIFWFRKQRQGIDLSAREPSDDTAFRTMLMMVGHVLASVIIGARLYWPRYQLNLEHMDISSEYSYLAAQAISSVAFLLIWFFLPTFCFKLGSHFFGAGLLAQRKKND